MVHLCLWDSFHSLYRNKTVPKYDQELSQSHTTDQPKIPSGRDQEHRQPQQFK